MRLFHTSLILAAGSMFVGMAWAWLIARDAAWEKMLTVNSHIREITYADSVLNVEVLRIRSAVVDHYDDVSRASQGLYEAGQSLQDKVQRLQIQAPDMGSALQNLQRQITSKLNFVENLKAQNSILRNSESYLPALLEDYAEEASKAPLHVIQSLLLRTLVLTDQTAGANLKQQLDALMTPDEAQNLERVATRVGMHGLKTLELRQSIQPMLQDFLSIPVHDAIVQLNQAFIREQARQENIRERSRNVLYMSAFGFFLLSFVILFRFIRLNLKTSMFVPFEMLSLLGKKTLLDIEYGTSTQKEMTVMFVDLRDFSRTCEARRPAENFAFVNEYLAAITPAIQQHGGFVSQFSGDGIMALFPGSADDALHAATHLIRALDSLNLGRRSRGDDIISLGIGINTSELMLGTIGHQKRMECTVLGNGVNVAARVEGLTRVYGCKVLFTESTLQGLRHPESFCFRNIDRVRPKGLQEPILLLELLLDANDPDSQQKIQAGTEFQEARRLYQAQRFEEAERIFARLGGYDTVSALYLQRCHERRGIPTDPQWDGVADFQSK